jgi:hypothetical protein
LRCDEPDVLADAQADAAQVPMSLAEPVPRTSGSRRRCAFIDGFSIHADTVVDAPDRPAAATVPTASLRRSRFSPSPRRRLAHPRCTPSAQRFPFSEAGGACRPEKPQRIAYPLHVEMDGEGWTVYGLHAFGTPIPARRCADSHQALAAIPHLQHMLRNPVSAGAYTFGRTLSDACNQDNPGVRN